MIETNTNKKNGTSSTPHRLRDAKSFAKNAAMFDSSGKYVYIISENRNYTHLSFVGRFHASFNFIANS